MSYSQPDIVTYTFPAVDFGTGGLTTAIKAPAGYKNGRIIDVGCRVTETFACDGTPGSVSIGTTGDGDAYAKLNIADGTAATDFFNTQDDTDAIIEADVTNTQLEVVCAVGVDAGTEAGIGDVVIVIGWF